jgi:beta-glucosidase
VTPDDVPAALTVEEKATLTGGADLWHTAAVPRVGLPALRLSDGPNGVRGTAATSDAGGAPSACFPAGTALGATWDVDLVGEIGAALAREAADKGVQVVLAPTLNLHRHPLAGRNFECFSEDPHLAGRLGAALVIGLQRHGVAATAKHLVANDAEVDRYRVSAEVRERVLRELYLVPFEMAVREAGVWAVMAAYNRLNGTHCDAHRWLLHEVLKGEWGFDGVVMSDWHGTTSGVPSARAGLDLEMPGPARFLGAGLAGAVRAGELPEAVLDDTARRLVRTVQRTSPPPVPGPERGIERAATWALARRAATSSMVLLRDQGLLPLRPEPGSTVAVIGPNADPGVIMGGGSAAVRPWRASSPLEALTAAFGPDVVVRSEPGCRTERLCPPVEPVTLDPPGIRRALYRGPEPDGDPVVVEAVRAVDVPLDGPEGHGAGDDGWSVAWTMTWRPAVGGWHHLGVSAVGRSRVFADGELVVDNWTDPRPGHTFYAWGSAERRGELHVPAGRPVRLRVEYRPGGGPLRGIHFGIDPPHDAHLLDRAVIAARAADVAVVVVGSNPEWETEGSDRPHLHLPGRQNDLVEAVLSANRDTVVVVNAGSPVTMHWAERAPVLLYAWYPGMAFGEALAAVLTGAAEATGRLPTTFPRRLEDHPAYLHYPPEAGRLVYGEGVYVGYRGFDALDTEPLFPFGFGLSASSFAYEDPVVTVVDRDAHRAEVRVTVTNVGSRRGTEVVQLYVADVEASVGRPPKELRGFAKLALDPGEARVVTFGLDHRAFAFWDEPSGRWRVEPGRFDLLLGSSSRHIRAQTAVTW